MIISVGIRAIAAAVAKAGSKKPVVNVNKETSISSNQIELANRGSTGRTEPNNLYEQLAMEKVKANPLDGATELNKIVMNDARWPAEEGWVKMQNVVTSYTTKTTIHYVYNPRLNLVDDFKIINFIFLDI